MREWIMSIICLMEAPQRDITGATAPGLLAAKSAAQDTSPVWSSARLKMRRTLIICVRRSLDLSATAHATSSSVHKPAAGRLASGAHVR